MTLIPGIHFPTNREEPVKQRKAAILANSDTLGASNGPTEAINGVIETTSRIARGFRNFTN